MKQYLLCLLTFIFAVCSINTLLGQGSCSDGSYNFSDISLILDSSNCDNCHTGASSQGGWNYNTYAGLIAVGNCGVANVVSGNALGSLLYDKIDGDGAVSCGAAMPNGAPPTAAAFSVADLAAIETWINSGALESCPPPSTCPTVILNDANLPNLPPAVCADDLLSLCFDVSVDEATFNPTSIQFNYNLTIDGTPSTVILNTIYTSGGGIDPNSTGQLCFETTVPVGTDVCAPYELSLEIIDVFYNDADCADNFVAYDLNITAPVAVMQTGDNLNDLIPLLTIGGLNPILVQIFPNPNWSANITQLPACDGTTLGTIEILAADGTTVCETLTDIGTAGTDGCPVEDAILPETLYENYTTYLDADTIAQPNPCAISIIVAEQTIACEDQCVICPTVVSASQEASVCQSAASIQFCVTFDTTVDASTVVTVEGISLDGAAGGTQICIDVPFTAPFNPCSGASIDFMATATCDNTDLLNGFIWLGTQILPITDPACGGIAGCTDNTACNFNPNAVCDDPSNPCLAPPFCNTDPCIGDTEIVDPNDACNCIVDMPQLLGCTDAAACNFNANANCDDGSCDFGNTSCADPCNPATGCTDASACNFDPNACVDNGSCQAPPCNPGCTDACADNFDPNADADDGTCNFYDDTCNADCTAGPFGGVWDAATCACINETTPVNGCTDATATNYNAAANCDDNSCMFLMCDDPCAPNFGAAGACEAYDMTCNADCTAGPFGGIWDAATCACINETTPVNGCTDPLAGNYDPAANCENGSCITVCEEEINGAIIVDDPACDVGGIDIFIIAPDGTSITVTTAADGTFSVPGGPFPCGDYTAAFADVSSLPFCYTSTGSTDPIAFAVNGQGGGNDGPFFFSNPEVPTLSQWGLISLALLLMIYGALKLSASTLIFISYKKK